MTFAQTKAHVLLSWITVTHPRLSRMPPWEGAWSVEKSDPRLKHKFLKFSYLCAQVDAAASDFPTWLCLCGFPPLLPPLSSFHLYFNSSHIQLKVGQNEILKSKEISTKLIKYWYRPGIAEIALHMYFILPPPHTHTWYLNIIFLNLNTFGLLHLLSSLPQSPPFSVVFLTPPPSCIYVTSLEFQGFSWSAFLRNLLCAI